MSLEQRVEKAKKLIIVEIPNAPTATFGTWGRKNGFYRVPLTRPANPHQSTTEINRCQIRLENIFVECIQQAVRIQDGNIFSNNYNCKGNCKDNTICYHSMGVLFEAFDKQGMEIEFCRDEFVARGRIGRDEWDREKNSSHLAYIKSKQGRGSIWAVIRDKMKTVDHGSMEERVNLMRGNKTEEEEIN